MKKKLMVRVRGWQLGLVLLLGLGAVWMGALHTFRHPWDAVPAAGKIRLPVEARREPVEVKGIARERARERAREIGDAFYRMLDSLKADSHGRTVYDSLMRARPGMMDSAGKMEGLFK